MSVSPLFSQDRALLLKLALAVALKLIVLALLWWLFIDGQQVAVDDSGMAAQMLHPHTSPTAPGESPSKE